ncbi:putative B3 domain-containing protein Os06g0632500 [Phoenix dactylifera]|uniref:B3 domain-containing protein Os06g0632500 n=1 Tax=Phoenix dactylifera TaxID=42345 RepID=A0A8B8ZW65_PHODC|nr:putative B3 domain-containing protein Os06g0632500 [Phoenix dactylifera]
MGEEGEEQMLEKEAKWLQMKYLIIRIENVDSRKKKRPHPKLLIPPKFRQHLANDNHGEATILSPLGKFWHVNLQREGREMFFGSGWEDFANAHGLSVGHFLVFLYQGNMVFTIKIFENSGCLKEYGSTASKFADKKEVNLDDEILDDAPKDIAVEKGRSKSSRRKCPNRRKRVPYFERIAVPKAFCLSNGLTTKCEITLKDRKQRLWPALFRLGSREGYIGRGWRCFSEGNDLKEGDKCIFELVSKKVMRVRIVRR